VRTISDTPPGAHVDDVVLAAVLHIADRCAAKVLSPGAATTSKCRSSGRIATTGPCRRRVAAPGARVEREAAAGQLQRAPPDLRTFSGTSLR
jgi:hypothetical protein